MIASPSFGGEVDNVLDGLTPFMIASPNYHRAARTQLEFNTYGLLLFGTGSASLAEVHELTEPQLNSPQNPL